MNSELIIMTFSNQDEAFRTRMALEMLQDSHTLGLETSVILTKDSSDHVTLHERRALSGGSPTPVQLLPGRLADAIFAGSDETDRSLAEVGLDTLFLEETISAFKPGGSVFFIYISQDDIVDTQRLLNTLPQFRGTTFHTVFSKRIEDQLLTQLA